ncbi:YhcN/YlaJ family sporulation lipoprotein [Sporosarcina sp. Marseille-Q4063]|uniref:YhcN/YlaJ family sporulation lipoprotein n=1 Tax=Sporosarcina sp. Marseille-Q4063 TaxID=2810514 RepID=UPI001BB042D6|nr:YhcN/YlaJ family sporulation lipoprotein [Sporosarcina sp. Marseille-Q4063]QUW22064.1 YhcN/YlaJ family sporulation lipoprotein [Sporosarcina sp. Marseille-Q4063]
MKKVSLFLTAMLLSLSLMGCNFNKDKNNNATDTADTNVDQGTEDNANNDNNNGDTNLEVAQDAADRITELDGVESATVIVTDQNAYAAVVLDGDTTDESGNNDNNDDTASNENNDTDTGTDTDTDTDTNNDNANQELSSDLENKIAEKVKEANDNIENVYVSLNPDFVDRMTDYADKIDQGEPVEGFFEEFSEAVQRVFPDAK